jgi:hypothetical protein
MKATQGGTFALEPNPTVCQESEYIRNKSKALEGVSGKAPPTIVPNLDLEEIKVMIKTNMEMESIGRFSNQDIGDGGLTSSISAFSNASSFKSRAELVTDVLSSCRELFRQVREIAARVLSTANCSCDPRGGTKRAIT